jgi:RNA polymerase sigma-70 factor (ECF subfamily)
VLADLLLSSAIVLAAGARASEIDRFEELIREHGAALDRLTLGYEASVEARRDLKQEILVALWRALPSFEGRSSLKTWAFRVAHNVATSHLIRARRSSLRRWQSLEEVAELPSAADAERTVLSRMNVERLGLLLRELRAVDRQLVLLFLEGFSPREIAEVTGLSDTNVTTKLSRLRAVLRAELEGGTRDE